MNNEDLIIGVHGDDNLVGGRYNVLSSFTLGLLKAFQRAGVTAYKTKRCFEKNLLPNLTIGFNVSGHETWSEYLKAIPNIMWSVDSVFFQNIELIDKFYTNPRFVLFNVSPSDNEALSEFYPQLKQSYLPHAVDLELWGKQDVEKEYDIVFLSSIEDYETKIEELRLSLPKSTFDLLMMIYDTWLAVPNLSFWELYQIFKNQSSLSLNLVDYNFVFKNISYLVTYTKRVQAVEKLKDFNVKVFGNKTWAKYVSGNVQYMGECDLLESINVVNKAKIVLHSQPSQIPSGLHERVLNASAVETFVMSSDSQSIKNEFGECMGYYSNKTLENLPEEIEYYLKHADERISKAKDARKIVAEYHTWDVRAQQILNMLP